MLPPTSSSFRAPPFCASRNQDTRALDYYYYLTPFTTRQRTHDAHERLNRAQALPAAARASNNSKFRVTTMISTLLLLLFLALPILPTTLGISSPPPLQSTTVHLELARVDALSSANLTDHELLRRAVQRSLDRAAAAGGGADGHSNSNKAAVEVPLVQGGGEYLVKLGVGTPQHVVSAAIDTASDLVWMQCQPCVSCYRQADPVFNPKLSSSFAVVPCGSDTCDQLDEHRCRDEDDDNACEYTYRYSGNAVTKGTLGMDKLVVGGNVFHGVVFGCSDSVSAGGGGLPPPPQASSGLVGLGRGPLSLVSQLSVRRFMYCLPPPLSRTTGKLVLGAGADAVRNATDRVAVTMSSDARYPSYYYLNLDGLAVGDRTPRDLNSRNNRRKRKTMTSPSPPGASVGDRAHAHGMIVDIASTISFLEASLYEELADDLEQEIRLPRGAASRLGLDLCFILPEGVGMDRVYVPSVSLSFDGRWLELDRDRLFVEDRTGRLMCLMIGKTNGVSILGNYQQQNMQVLYNLRRGRITFAKATCDSVS
ncbi:hypothetical protein QOZ80_4BG0346990 [Eleusine coracana subsp. coracana]|nr:hypothetical protein QOZ80_4BG0346990 [Eleusine coracana subsp. coracana]